MSSSYDITVSCGTQNQKIRLEKTFDSLLKKLKEMFHIDWNITSLLCEGEEIKDQISYNKYINEKSGLQLEINSSFDILQDYIEDTIRDCLDKKYEELLASIREYIKKNYSAMTITQLISTLQAISIEPNYCRVSFKEIQEKPKIVPKQIIQNNTKTISLHTPLISNNNITHNVRDIHVLNNSLNDTSFTHSSNISNIGIMPSDLTSNDSFRKDRFQHQQNKEREKNRKPQRGMKEPTKLVHNNPVAINSSDFLKNINQDFNIYKKFEDNIINQCYKKNNTLEEYLILLYKQNYITLDDFSFDKI